MKDTQFWQVSEVTISYHPNPQLIHKPKISTSKDAETILRSNWSNDIELFEEFVVMFLNRSNQVKGLFRVSKGGTSSTVVDPKIIFAAALKSMAAAVIIAHNHPSGNLEPSKADIELTKRLREIGIMLEMPIMDHIIIAPGSGYFSFADESII